MAEEDLQEFWRDVRAKPVPPVYEGRRLKTGKCRVTVLRGGKTSHLKLYKSTMNHSPTGFEWGYEGSGPAQLALAILCDVLGKGQKTRALKLHQAFKRAIVIHLPSAKWTLTSQQVLDAVARLEGPGKGGDRGG